MSPTPRHEHESHAPEPAAVPCVLRFRVARAQGTIATLFANLREHGVEIVRWVARNDLDLSGIELTVFGRGSAAAAAYAEGVTGVERRIA